MPPPNRTTTRKIAEVVAREIAFDIARSGVASGTMIAAEADLLQQFGVGRATLREALRILEINGIVALKPGRGGGIIAIGEHADRYAELSKLHLQAVHSTYGEVLEARLAIEPLLARFCAINRTDAMVTALQAAVEGSDTMSPYDVAANQHAYGDFHTIIGQHCGNRALMLLSQVLMSVYLTRLGVAFLPLEDRPHLHEAHREIGEAIANGDADTAEHLMRSHMVHYADSIRSRNANVFDESITWT